MKHIFGASLVEPIPEQYKEQFRQRLNVQNCRRTFIINIISVSFTSLLFLLDWMRYQRGNLFGDPIKNLLVATHVLVLFQLIPMWLIARHFTAVKEGAYDYGRKLSLLTLILLIIAMLPMSVISFMNRGSVAIFAIYIGVINIVVLLPHRDRLILNGLNTGVFLVAVVWLRRNNIDLLVVNVSETLALMIPNLVFATYQYNLSVKQFKNVRLLAAQKDEIESEKKRSDDLLHNILPVSIADELRQNGFAQPRKYEEATVLFSDFSGFSHICRQLSPEELISDLSYCFGRFDEIIALYGIERIKTIGDAYMCVAGVPEPTPDHALRMMYVARDMHHFLAEWEQERLQTGQPVFRARIGVHSGPVTGGVVGTAKFAFDIWGDTVNVAARMEHNSSPGRINVSADTYQLTKDQFDFMARGSIPVKNIGEVEMYFTRLSPDKDTESHKPL
jgi:class 3 adenylate cyclase